MPTRLRDVPTPIHPDPGQPAAPTAAVGAPGWERSRPVRRVLGTVHRVAFKVAPGNAASLRVVEAAGFRPIGAEVLFHRDGADPS